MGVVFVFGDGYFTVGDGVPAWVAYWVWYVVALVLVGDAEYPPLHACGQDA